jgi:hypothetical protein
MVPSARTTIVPSRTGMRQRARARRIGSIGMAFAAATRSITAFAGVQLSPYAAGEYEHSSNIFYQGGGLATTPVGTNGSGTADSILKSRLGIDAEYDWSQQKFFATAEGRRFVYNNFSSLDHNEGLLNGGLDWKLTHLLDGALEYRHERRMVPFSEIPSTRTLFLETEDIGTAAVNVQVAARWRWENRFKIRNLDSPRAGLPNLKLRETSEHEAVRYLVVGGLSVGLDAEYLQGSFSGITGLATPFYTPTSSYHQTTGQLAVDYKVSGLSTLNAAVGYTSRSDLGGAGTAAVSGQVRYERELTGKTSASLQLFRLVNSYVTTAGTEVDTGVAAKLIWRPTERIEVSPGYYYTQSSFPGQTFGSGSSRSDNFQAITLDVRYHVLDSVELHPYSRYNVRRSNIASDGFNVTEVGLELLVKVPK